MQINLYNEKTVWKLLLFLFPLIYRLYTIDSVRVTAWFIISLTAIFTYQLYIVKLKGNLIYPALFSLACIFTLPFTDIYNMFNTTTTNKFILNILTLLFCLLFIYMIFIFSWKIFYCLNKLNFSSYSKNKTYIQLIQFPDIIKFSLYPLIGFGLEFMKFYPAKLTADSLDQIAQIRKEIPYTDIHSIGHTLFCGALMKIWNNPGIVIIFQIISMSFVVGFALAYFKTKRIPNNILLTISMLFACFSPNRNIITFFWKDNLYTVAIIFSSLLLMIYLDRRVNTSIYLLILGGVSSASIFLFRHNGLIVYLSLVIIFLYFMLKYSTKFLIPIASSLIIIISMYYYSFEVLHTIPNYHGAKYAIFAKAIVSVVSNNGMISLSQLKEITNIVPKDIILKSYNWNEGGTLLWIFGTSDYPTFIYNQAIINNHKKIINLFFQLFPKNIGIMTWDILGSSSLVWQFNLNFLDKNITYMYFISLYLFILINKKFYNNLLPFYPVLFNILSIAISNTTYEPRYTYATVAMFPFITLYIYYLTTTSSGID